MPGILVSGRLQPWYWPDPCLPWWRHQMETCSALLTICAGNSPVLCEFPAQRPVMWSFGVFFDLRLNKRLSKQSWGWWFETLPRPFWRHSNVYDTSNYIHYIDVIMSAAASQITGISIIYSILCSGADQIKHQSSASLAFVRGIHRWPVDSPHKEPVTRKISICWRHHVHEN